MPRYLLLVQYDAEGSKNLLREKATVREAAFRKAIESIRGKVDSLYFVASGEYQFAAIVDYPEAATAAALMAMTVSTGAVAKFNLIELITAGDIDRAYAALIDPASSPS